MLLTRGDTAATQAAFSVRDLRRLL
jgi:hypothetical protein